MTESRYIRYDKRRLPRQKRTIPIHGAVSYVDGRPVKDQSNVFFRCWNCGFICRTDRDKLGDGEGFVIEDQADVLTGSQTVITGGTAATNTEQFSVLNMGASAYEFPQGNALQDVSCSLEDNKTIHLMQLDSEGNPFTVMHNFSTKVTSGCPFCGCRQYK
jgi:hypothetical protein